MMSSIMRHSSDDQQRRSEINVVQATSPSQIAIAKTLFIEYATELGVDLGFQRFAEELAGLPGAYSPPAGCLLLAERDEQAVGCVALRPLSATVCEMKRLYVKPEVRGCGVGRRLATRIIEEAHRHGYEAMRLDTLASMVPAIRLYEALGFVRRSAYYDTPLADTVFMELTLRASSRKAP